MRETARRLLAEGLGTGLLVAVVVGSGIMGNELAGGNAALALLGNTLATGAALVVLILIFGPISGAHFNPLVSLVMAWRGALSWQLVPLYIGVQCSAGIAGTMLAHHMFDEPLWSVYQSARTGWGIWTGEVVASCGLLLTILSCLRHQPGVVPYAVGLFISAGYWFTSSTSFANPAVTLARSFSNSFAGIRFLDVPAFVVAQLLGAMLALVLWRALTGQQRQP